MEKLDKQMVKQVSEIQLRRLVLRRLARLMAPSDEVHRSSSRAYFARTVPEAMVAVAAKLHRHGWLAYLVGGTLRDLLVGLDRRGDFQPRDVDIVVDGATREDLQDVLRDLVLERFTRFGGLHLSAPLSSGSRIVFDIWTLADTWGFQSKHIAPRIADFPGTTFLNIDSCATELMQPEGRERTIFEKGFFNGIANRVLDVNYEPNPYPHVCVARALVLAAQLEFTITRPLAKFILDQWAAGGVNALVEAQLSHYGTVRSGAQELKVWLEEIRRQLDSGQKAISLQVRPARRQELWRDYRVADTTKQQLTVS